MSFNDSHLHKISHILDFTPDDLSKNRRGYISARQIKILESHINRVYTNAINILLTALVVFGILTVSNWMSSGLCFMMPSIAAGMFILILKYEQRQLLEELPQQPVWTSTAHLNSITKQAKGLGISPFWHTDSDDILSIPNDLFKALHPNRVYETYYLELNTAFKSKRFTLLSVEPTTEWIDKSKRKKKSL